MANPGPIASFQNLTDETHDQHVHNCAEHWLQCDIVAPDGCLMISDATSQAMGLCELAAFGVDFAQKDRVRKDCSAIIWHVRTMNLTVMSITLTAKEEIWV